MILTKQTDADLKSFEKLLDKSVASLIELNNQNTLDCSGVKLEPILLKKLEDNAKGTSFEGTLEATGKHAFPDILSKIHANDWLGIEVKTSKDSWKCFGNSIFETTRPDYVGNIYIFFAKMDDFSLKWAKYEDVLETINITHSPRYSINMDLTRSEADSVFKLMDVAYDTFRAADITTKMKHIKALKRRQHGEELALWWLSPKENQGDDNYKVSLLEEFPREKRNMLIAECLARFPKVFGPVGSSKYSDPTKWMLTEHGITSSSFRDKFSAGGKATITFQGKKFELPRVFQKISEHQKYINIAFDKIADDKQRTTTNIKKAWIDEVYYIAKSTVPATFPLKDWLKKQLNV